MDFAKTVKFTLDATRLGGGYYTMQFGLNGQFSGSFVGPSGSASTALVDGAAIAINAALGNVFTFTAASDAARVFGVPTGGILGQRVYLYLTNTSGGALTATTFHASILQGTVTLMATAKSREYVLRCLSATVPTWALVAQTAVDIGT